MVADLCALLDELEDHGVGVHIVKPAIDTRSAARRLVFTIVGAVAVMKRELLIERTRSGLATARARGRVGGRVRSYTPTQQREAQRLYDHYGGRLELLDCASIPSPPRTGTRRDEPCPRSR